MPALLSPNRRRVAAAAALLIAAALLVGCKSARPTTSLPVPQPATAPAPAVEPAGAVWSVGSTPEGIAAAGDLVAVAVQDPNRLLLLTADAGSVVHTVPLPGTARHVAASGDRFYVAAGQELLIVPVEAGAPSGEPITHSLAGTGHNVTPLPDGGALVAIDDGRAQLVGTENDDVIDIGTHVDGVAIAGDQFGVIDSPTSALAIYDARTRKQRQKTRAGEGATHVVADRRGRFVVVDSRGGELLIFSRNPLFLRQRFPVDGTPYGLAYDAANDVLWTTLTARNEVVGFALDGGAPREVARHPTVRQPDSVAVGPRGELYVAGRQSDSVQMITNSR